MKIHNIMEERVIERINKLYEQLKILKPAWFTCDCESCRLDAVSYVLNRIPPKYVVSERGITHINAEDNHQLNADIDALGMKGIKLVNESKRPYHYKTHKSTAGQADRPFFNFPIFSGIIYNGDTFEPLDEAEITITSNNEPAKMIDTTWSNPFMMTNSTNGNYSFWIKPIQAKKVNENKKFNFTVSVTAKGYSPVSHAFEISLVSEQCNRDITNSIYALQIQDIFLFEEGTENPME